MREAFQHNRNGKCAEKMAKQFETSRLQRIGGARGVSAACLGDLWLSEFLSTKQRVCVAVSGFQLRK